MGLLKIGILVGGLGLCLLLVIVKSYLRREDIVKVDRIMFVCSLVMIGIGIVLSVIGWILRWDGFINYYLGVLL